MKRLVLVVALLAAIPAMLVGCSESESETVKHSITEFVNAFNAGDYEMCTAFLVGITDANKETIKGQLQALKEQNQLNLEVVSIDEVSVDGSSATAKVTLKVTYGGQSAEQTITIPLSKVNGTWKFAGEDIIPHTGG